MLAHQRRVAPWIILVLLGILAAQTFTHLAWLPISAHSGQVALPWMMNQGKTLFGDLLEQHAPGTSILAAFAMRLVNADPILVTRLLNLLLVLALTLLIFSVARALAGALAGLFAALMWFWWEPVYGNVLFYFDSLVGLLVVLALALWLALGARKPGWLAPLAVGLVLGGATLAKQHAWAAVVVFGLWLFFNRRNKLIIFAAGALVLPLLTVVIAALQGDLQAYLYWNWQFNFSGLMPDLLPTGDLVRKLVLSNLFVPAFFLLALRRERNRLWLLVGLLWLAATSDLLPRFSDDQAMAHLPLACIIGGAVVATLLPARWSVRAGWRQASNAGVALAGLLFLLLIGWFWTGAAVYASAPLGRAGIPAYDEFKPLAAALRQDSQPGDTLFVLPETDSTPQIHVLSGMLPPETWIKGWYWYFDAPGILDQLSQQWDSHPPTFLVYFPDLISQGQPGIARLVAFMNAHYQLIETVPAVVFHGDALIYRYAH